MSLLSRFVNFTRLLFANAKHRRNVAKSRKLLTKLDEIRKLYPDTAAPRIIAYLRHIDPYLFEELILSAFERRGHFVLRGLSYSGDGGFDGKVYFKKRWWRIQAKRYGAHVKAAHIAQFDQQLNDLDTYGFFIHTGKTGVQTMKLTKSSRTKVVSGTALFHLLTTQA